MSDLLMGELLCLFLLVLVNGRIFFVSHKNSITIAVLSPVNLIISFFLIIAQGPSIPVLMIFILAVFTFILNIHAFSRFISNLYIDIYRPAFYIFSLILFFVSLSLTVFSIKYREFPVNAEKYGVSEVKEISEDRNTVLWTFKPLKNEGLEKKPVVIFNADKRGDTYRYRPYLILLAHSGHTVYSIDSYGESMPYFSSWMDLQFVRRSALIYSSLKNPELYNEMQNRIIQNSLKEYVELFLIAQKKEEADTQYVFIGDCIQPDAIQAAIGKYDNRVKGFFQISSVDLYTTKGYGYIALTAPVLARFMGVKREDSLLVPSYMVLQTEKAIALMESPTDSFSLESVTEK